MGCGNSSENKSFKETISQNETKENKRFTEQNRKKSLMPGYLVEANEVSDDFLYYSNKLKSLNFPTLSIKDKDYIKDMEIESERYSYFVKTLDYEFESHIIENLASKPNLMMNLQERLNSIDPQFLLHIDIKDKLNKVHMILVMKYIEDLNNSRKFSLLNIKNLREIELKNNKYLIENLKRILFSIRSNKSCVKKLKVDSNLQLKLIECILHNMIFTSLEKLELGNGEINDEDIVNFQQFFSQNLSLKGLKIFGNKIDIQNRGCQKLMLFCIKNNHFPLKKLDLSNNFLSENGLISVADLCVEKKLVSLKLQNIGLTDFSISIQFLRKISTNIELKVLDMSQNNLDLDIITEIINNKDTSIQKLILNKIKIKKENNLKDFSSSFIHSIPLNTLSFSFEIINELDIETYSKSFTMLFEGLDLSEHSDYRKVLKINFNEISLLNNDQINSRINNILELDLSSCKFNQNSFISIIKSIEKSKNIRKLILRNTSLTFEDYSCLSNMIALSNSLSSLDLSCSSIDSPSLQILCDGCLKNKDSLKELILDSLIREIDLNKNVFQLINGKLNTLSLLDNDFESESIKSLTENTIRGSLKTIRIGLKKCIEIGKDLLKIIFSQTNDIEKLYIKNINVEKDIFESFLNNNSLKELDFINAECDGSILLILNKATNLERLAVSVSTLREEEAISLCKTLSHLKHAKLVIENLGYNIAEILIESLKDNKIIEFFELFNKDVNDKMFEKCLSKYYDYVITCDKLINIQIIFIEENHTEEMIRKRNEAINLFKDFFQIKEIKDPF